MRRASIGRRRRGWQSARSERSRPARWAVAARRGQSLAGSGLASLVLSGVEPTLTACPCPPWSPVPRRRTRRRSACPSSCRRTRPGRATGRRAVVVRPMGTIGAPPARRSSRLSAVRTTMTWVSHTWLCRRVPFLIMLAPWSVSFGVQFARRVRGAAPCRSRWWAARRGTPPGRGCGIRAVGSRTCSRSSSGSGLAPAAGTTTATMIWPHSGRRRRRPTQSCTWGCSTRTSSISAGAMFSPPRMMVSSERPPMNR